MRKGRPSAIGKTVSIRLAVPVVVSNRVSLHWGVHADLGARPWEGRSGLHGSVAGPVAGTQPS